MAKKLLCLFLVLILVLSMSMVSFADCSAWKHLGYEFAYCATPICAGADIPTAYGYENYEMSCTNGEYYLKKVLVAKGCCNP